MTTQVISGVLNCTSGFKIPLNLTMTDATEANLTTDTAFTVTAQNIGDFAPGQTITSGVIVADDNIGYAYILRKGLILSLIPYNNKGVGGGSPALSQAVTLMPGDLLRVLPLAASARNCALSVVTNQGVPRIFIGTPAGAATTQLLDLQTSLSIGETLTGQVCTAAKFTTIDQDKITSVAGGAQVTMQNGNLAGAVQSTDPVQFMPHLTPCAIPVSLNFTAQVITSA